MALHVAALWAIAVAQPLFDLLGNNPEFFVAHRAGAADVLAVTLALALLPPSLLTGLVWLAGLAGARARTMALGVVVGGLGCLLAMQLAFAPARRTGVSPIPIAMALGAAVAFAHHRLAARADASSGAVNCHARHPGAVPPETRDPAPGRRTGRLGEPHGDRHASRGASVATPVVVVILDEVPLVSLLDADRQIDRRLYPNFAALAGDGVWYRNATTVHDFTRWAVPSIVTGRYPSHRRCRRLSITRTRCSRS